MQFLKQSTAVTVKIGPFVDDTDGKTAETGLTISQADVRLSKNGGNMAQKNNASSCTHDEIGHYDCPFSTTDTNTLGVLQLMVLESGALSVWAEYMILPANIYDSWFSTDKQQVDVTQWLGVAVTAGVGNRPAVDAEAISGSTTAADNVEANITNLDATVSSRSDFDETTDPVELIDSGGSAGTSAAELVDDVWEELLADHVTAATFGKQVNDLLTDANYKDFETKITVTSTQAATPEKIPKVYTRGTAGNLKTITVTVDGDDVVSTEIGV